MSRKLTEFFFGPANIVISHIHETYDCKSVNNDSLGKYQFKVTCDDKDIIKRSYDEKSESSSGKVKFKIDDHHYFNIISNNTYVILNFFKDNIKRTEVGIKFLTKRLSLVQDIPTFIKSRSSTVPSSYNKTCTDFPIENTNLVLWLDASDLSTIVSSSSGLISQWIDKSKSKADAVPFFGDIKYSEESLNSLPGIILNESSLYSPLPVGTFNNGVTFFVVFSSVGDQPYNALISRSDCSNSQYPGPWDLYNNEVYIGNSYSNNIGSVAISTNLTLAADIKPSISIFQASNSTPISYLLGNNYYTDNSLKTKYQDTGSYIYIGSRADGATSFNGVMSEILIFNSILTMEQVDSVKIYLSKKWNITCDKVNFD